MKISKSIADDFHICWVWSSEKMPMYSGISDKIALGTNDLIQSGIRYVTYDLEA